MVTREVIIRRLIRMKIECKIALCQQCKSKLKGFWSECKNILLVRNPHKNSSRDEYFILALLSTLNMSFSVSLNLKLIDHQIPQKPHVPNVVHEVNGGLLSLG